MDRAEACSIMGVGGDADRAEVENRYLVLLKRYKPYGDDERPFGVAPSFDMINEAYRFLIGYVPLQKEQFSTLNGWGKVRYIREYFMPEIIMGLVITLVIGLAGYGTYDMYRALQEQPPEESETPAIAPLPEQHDWPMSPSPVHIAPPAME